jgi:ABC-type sugar transport system ATPase subunit
MKLSETVAQPQVSPAPLLIATGIEKTFERTRALVGAELDLYPGEVMGLLGANGAGKSTLSKVISGHTTRDEGSITFGDRPLNLRSAREAIQHGITMVMQETSLAPDLSVLENVFLAELGSPGFLSYGRLKRRAEEILDRLGQRETLPLNREVRLLSAAQRQLVEIAKALALNSTLIIFDEPTASLSPPEVERLFQVMTTLKRSGHTLVFVSHRLEEVFAITDRVTVMREGRTVAKSLATASLRQAELIRLMVGQELKPMLANRPNYTGIQSSSRRRPLFAMFLSKCTVEKFSVWEDWLERGALKRWRRSLVFVLDNMGNSISTGNPMRRGARRMRFARASDSSLRTDEIRELCPISRSERISC